MAASRLFKNIFFYFFLYICFDMERDPKISNQFVPIQNTQC